MREKHHKKIIRGNNEEYHYYLHIKTDEIRVKSYEKVKKNIRGVGMRKNGQHSLGTPTRHNI